MSPIDPSHFDEVEEAVESRDEVPIDMIPKRIEQLRSEMKEAADAMEYEKAAGLRDKIRELERVHLQFG
jgi:excinuclease UvrABC helicase subunit UvrB